MGSAPPAPLHGKLGRGAAHREAAGPPGWEAVGLHRAELVSELEAEGFVLVENEGEVEGDVQQLTDRISGLLDMGLTAPLALLAEATGQADQDGLLCKSLHGVSPSSLAMSSSPASAAYL